MSQKLDDYYKQFERLEKKWRDDVSAGLKTEEDFQTWRINKELTGDRWQKMSNELARDILKADNEARDLIKDYMPEAFADGYNRSCYTMARGMGDAYVNGTFTLYNKEAVTRLVRDNPRVLPQLKPESKTARDIRAGRIERWNRQKINSEITQGILQGESLPKIAKRMSNVVGMEHNSAIRNARTAVGSALNAGKEESYKDAVELGIEVEQMWVASVDDRTRVEHRLLDGQTVKVGEKFKVGAYEIGYPCDPEAEPEMVYNCRCTIIPILPKYEDKDDALKNAHSISDEDYEAWKHEQPVYDSANRDEPIDVKTPSITSSDKEYSVASNRDEATQALRDIGFAEIRGAENMDEQLYVSTANRLSELNDRFNAIPDGMSFEVKEFDGDDKERMFACVNHDTNTLMFNSYFFDDRQWLVDNVKELEQKDEDGRFYFMPTSVDNVELIIVTHEYGHMVEDTLLKPPASDATEEEGMAYMNKAMDFTTEIWTKAVEKNPDLKLEDSIGLYAQSSQLEFFAESFMNAFCGKSTAFGDAMRDWLKERGL